MSSRLGRVREWELRVGSDTLTFDQIKGLHRVDLQYLEIGQMDRGRAHTIPRYVNRLHVKFSNARKLALLLSIALSAFPIILFR